MRLLSLESETLDYLGVRLKNPYKTVISEGVTVIIGENGSGKSTLGKILTRGRNLSTNKIVSGREKLTVKFVQFNDIHSLGNNKVTYHQQRFESTMNDEVPTVRDYLGSKIDTEKWREWSTLLKIEEIGDKRVNFLSSGETRKLVIAGMLTDEIPDILILDNPYIGLDQEARKMTDDMIRGLKREGVSVVLLVADDIDVPDYTDYLLPVKNLEIGQMMDVREKSEQSENISAWLFGFKIDEKKLEKMFEKRSRSGGDEIAELRDCTVKYGKRILLEGINLKIKRGEKWVIRGRNGSGKSTLLSLIHADNPQAYSNLVRVFGRRRGSGESIWDVKKRIGYISSEMHLYFGGGGASVRDVIARGLNDTVGNYTKLSDKHYDAADSWISLFELGDIAERRFNTLSDGEQRMVLLARSFIKNPELLILDEPMHGLDKGRKAAIKQVIRKITEKGDMSIVFVTHCPEELPEGFDKELKLGI